MLRQRLILILLFVGCFSLAIWLDAKQSERDQAGKSSSFLALAFGDGRKLFANSTFAKADAYFHRGNYPSIFEINARREENHMSGEAAQGEAGHAEGDHEHEGHEHEEHEEGPPPSLDWIEAFGKHFRASVHVHLEKGEEREMLPWLQLSVELDPQSIEAYTVAAYWLSERLGKVDEAEQFLRQGLRANPKNPDILNELASLYLKHRHDPDRARNLWKLALRRWNEVEKPKEKPNDFLLDQILGGLFQVELQQGHTNQAIEYLEQMKAASPKPDQIQKKIDELKSTQGR
ncbi:MAG TPA: hypothetical protein VFW05_16020 [Verrucomicrobiae bacterium]|nr:hypothetical protein [Verrucomicrobiae bacterium]